MSPRTKAQNEEIRKQRMEQILTAAADVYLRKGQLMEIRDVAEAAGLGYGTVYHYYKNKLALLDDLLWQAFEQAERLTAVNGEPKQSAQEQLYAYGVRLLKHCLQNHSIYILYKLITDNFSPYPKERFFKLYDDFRDRLYLPVAELAAGVAENKRAGLPPDMYVNMLLGSIVGYAGLLIHHDDFDAKAEQLVGFIVNGSTGQ